MTIEICGEYLKQHTDLDIFGYFQSHYRHFFPRLRDRTLFVRQAANLWQVKAAMQQRRTQISGQADDPVQVIDTLPLPVCGYTRSRRDRCSSPLPITVIAQLKTSITMGSSSACGLLVPA